MRPSLTIYSHSHHRLPVTSQSTQPTCFWGGGPVYSVTAFTLKRCVFISLFKQSLFLLRIIVKLWLSLPINSSTISWKRRHFCEKNPKVVFSQEFFSSRSLQLLKRCFSLIFRSASLQKINYHPALALHFLRFREKPISPRISSFPPLFKCNWKYKTCNNSTQLSFQYIS